MTMSAATAIVVMMIMIAAAIVAAFAFAMMMSTSVTATCQHLDGLVDLFLCGIAVLADGACEVECLACQGMVSVNGDAVFLYLHHSGHKLMILAICQGDDGIGVDVLVVEMTVD